MLDEKLVNGLFKLNLGCGRSNIPGYVNIDRTLLPSVDKVFNLEMCSPQYPLPFPDNSVGEIIGVHFLEHIMNPLPLMQELHRVTVCGGKAKFTVPHGASDTAFEDPTHVRFYFPSSFGYFSQPFYWRADYGYRGDWQPKHITLKMPEQLCQKGTDIAFTISCQARNAVEEMVCELECIKPIREPKRELQVPPSIRIQPVRHVLGPLIEIKM